MTREKKILFLGGSRQQVPAVNKAQEMGYETVLCDYLKDNPGKEAADRFHLVSTTDKEQVLKVAELEAVDGVVAYASDPAAPTAAYVAEKMGFPTHPLRSVEVLTEKDRFRSFLSEHGFATPQAKGYASMEEAKKELEAFRFPLLIKPVDSSGSKGVSLLKKEDDLSGLAEYALSFSRVGRFILEEYVSMDGYQVAGDGFSVDGKLTFRCFANDHFSTRGGSPFVPISASFPYEKPRRIHDKIHREIQRLLTLLDMKTGAYNFDIRLDKDENIYLMEVGPRNGGNYIPQVIEYATGVDMIACTLKAAVGEKVDDLTMKEPEGFWSYYAVHSHQEGVLQDIWIDPRVKRDYLVESHYTRKIGDKVARFTGANTALGILIMTFPSMETMLDHMDHCEKWIRLDVK